MNEQSNQDISTQSFSWEPVGRWARGTAVAVAVGQGPRGVQRLAGAPAGLYAWGLGTEPTPVLTGVIDPNIVALTLVGRGANLTALAGTAGGRLLRGQAPDFHWSEVESWAGLGVATVLAPAPGEAQRNTLFIGTPAGIFRTLDAGRSWESCNFGLLDEEVLCLACAPTFDESEILWAGTAGGGLYRSRNAGRAWRESGIGLPDAAVQALAFSPAFADDQMIYAGLEDEGVYRSSDGGESWLPWALKGAGVNALACGAEGTLWAGTSTGLFAVSPQGTVTPHLEPGLPILAVAAGLGREVLVATYDAGIYSSTDAGATWAEVDLALHAPPVVVKAGANLVALDNSGTLAISRDQGATWETLPPASDEGVFGIGASDGPELVAATGSGLLRLAPAATGWEAIRPDLFGEKSPLAVELSPDFGRDRTILAAAHDDELVLSQDGGATWRDITGPWQERSILRVRFGPAGSGDILVLTVAPTATGHFEVAVWQSQDHGRAWAGLVTLTTGLPAMLVAWPYDPHEQVLFLATQHRVVKLFQSPAGELQVHQSFFGEGTRVTALHTDPAYGTNGVIWAATSDGVMRSVDRGQSWQQAGSLPDGLPLVWLDTAPGTLHGVTLGGAVWRVAI